MARLARNFAIDYLKKSSTARARERQARTQLAPPDRSGPTEQDVVAWLEELEVLAPAWDIDRLRLICRIADGSRVTVTILYDVSPRTNRRWVAELLPKYGTSH
jgi:hypothetical protein